MYGYRAPRVLRSFPTRRSSDLDRLAVALADQRAGGAVRGEQAGADAFDVGAHLVFGLLVDGQVGDEAQDQAGVVGAGRADVQTHGCLDRDSAGWVKVPRVCHSSASSSR